MIVVLLLICLLWCCALLLDFCECLHVNIGDLSWLLIDLISLYDKYGFLALFSSSIFKHKNFHHMIALHAPPIYHAQQFHLRIICIIWLLLYNRYLILTYTCRIEGSIFATSLQSCYRFHNTTTNCDLYPVLSHNQFALINFNHVLYFESLMHTTIFFIACDFTNFTLCIRYYTE